MGSPRESRRITLSDARMAETLTELGQRRGADGPGRDARVARLQAPVRGGRIWPTCSTQRERRHLCRLAACRTVGDGLSGSQTDGWIV